MEKHDSSYKMKIRSSTFYNEQRVPFFVTVLLEIKIFCSQLVFETKYLRMKLVRKKKEKSPSAGLQFYMFCLCLFGKLRSRL